MQRKNFYNRTMTEFKEMLVANGKLGKEKMEQNLAAKLGKNKLTLQPKTD
jgi:hypothetical protein